MLALQGFGEIAPHRRLHDGRGFLGQAGIHFLPGREESLHQMRRVDVLGLAMIHEATKIYTEDYAYIPLHQQALVWAMRKNVDLVQPADNNFPLRFVNIK